MPGQPNIAASRWLPSPIFELESLAEKVIKSGEGFRNVYALRKNIAYNLQYLEFLDKTLSEGGLTSVLQKQTYKIFILVGCSIMESLLAYLLIKSGNYKMKEWELEQVMPGQEKVFCGEKRRIDATIYKKLKTKKREEMNYDAMIQKAETKKILGANHDIYAKLQKLRKLRNKVHLHLIDEPTDTDWNAFDYSHICNMAQVLYSVFTGSIFRPSQKEKDIFKYLEKYLLSEGSSNIL